MLSLINSNQFYKDNFKDLSKKSATFNRYYTAPSLKSSTLPTIIHRKSTQASLDKYHIIKLKSAAPPAKDALLKENGLVENFIHAATDVPQSISKGLRTYATIKDLNPLTNGSCSRSVAHSRNILSLNSLTSPITGYINSEKAKKALETASKINDIQGVHLAQLSLVRGNLDIASTVISLPETITEAAHITTTGKMAVVSKVLSKISFISTLTYLSTSITSATIKLNEITKKSHHFLKEAFKNDDKAINQLIESLVLDQDEFQNICHKVLNLYKKDPSTVKESLIDCKEFSLTKEDRDIVNQLANSLLDKGLIAQNDLSLIQEALISEVKKNYAAKQQSFIRVFGEKTLTGLINLFKEKDTEKQHLLKQDIIKSAQLSVDNGKFSQKMTLANAFNSLALTVIGHIFSSKFLYLIPQIISLVLSPYFIKSDFDSIYQTVLNQKANKQEKLVVVLIATLLTVLIISASIFSAGLINLVLSSIISTIFAGVSLACAYYTSSENQDNVQGNSFKESPV